MSNYRYIIQAAEKQLLINIDPHRVAPCTGPGFSRGVT
jgi:hypothetical protein